MAASDVIIEVRKRLGISRLKLANRLGLKSDNIIWLYEKKERFPSHQTWMKLVDIAKEVEMIVDIDSMRD